MDVWKGPNTRSWRRKGVSFASHTKSFRKTNHPLGFKGVPPSGGGA